MTPALLAELVAMAEDDARPLQRLFMHPTDIYHLVRHLAGESRMRARSSYDTWEIDGVQLVADPWCPRGTVVPDPPLARPARCRIHEDCRAYPELARACWEARWRSG